MSRTPRPMQARIRSKDIENGQTDRSPFHLDTEMSAKTLLQTSRLASREPLDPSQHGPAIEPEASQIETPAASTTPSTKTSTTHTPTSSAESLDIQEDNRLSYAAKPELKAGAAVKMDGSGPPELSTRKLSYPQGSALQLRATMLTPSRLSAPRSVRDLGSDYTRYFNPFAAQLEPVNRCHTPLPLRNPSKEPTSVCIAALDLERRLVTPFNVTETAPNEIMPMSVINGSVYNTRKPSSESHRSVSSAAGDALLTVEPSAARGRSDLDFHACSPFIDDRLNAPCALPLFTDEKEDDDDMHLPRWDDDVKYKAHWKDRCNAVNILNCIGGIFVVIGLMCVFVALPVLSWTGTGLFGYTYDTPLDQMPNPNLYDPWTHVNDKTYPLLQNLRTGLIDPDTPSSALSRTGVSGENLMLVFSDEFNERNRTFYHGDDPYWFAPDIWYGATQDLEWYDPDAVNTGGGTLQLQLDEFPSHGLNYRSGMLNSWNQLCFKGGVFEVSMSLPGPAGVHGLWPGAWTMGNLGRPGYISTTDGMWPYTYNRCDTGITPNQSMSDGTSHLPGQRLPSCTCTGADHPTPGTGRGAPEIDIAEMSADYSGLGIGVATQSFQVAPFDIWYYPNYEFMQNPNHRISSVNTYTGGPYQQAVSTTSMLNNAWYDGQEYQKFAFEYTPGDSANASVTWFIGDDEMMRFDARAIGPNGNVGQRLISEEPMSMILNLGISHSWTYIDFNALRFPTVLQVDYVRWYQPRDSQMVTCDPPGYETTEYIAGHPKAYNNPNITHWTESGYEWPNNTFMHGCSA